MLPDAPRVLNGPGSACAHRTCCYDTSGTAPYMMFIDAEWACLDATPTALPVP